MTLSRPAGARSCRDGVTTCDGVCDGAVILLASDGQTVRLVRVPGLPALTVLTQDVFNDWSLELCAGSAGGAAAVEARSSGVRRAPPIAQWHAPERPTFLSSRRVGGVVVSPRRVQGTWTRA